MLGLPQDVTTVTQPMVSKGEQWSRGNRRGLKCLTFCLSSPACTIVPLQLSIQTGPPTPEESVHRTGRRFARNSCGAIWSVLSSFSTRGIATAGTRTAIPVYRKLGERYRISACWRDTSPGIDAPLSKYTYRLHYSSLTVVSLSYPYNGPG